MGKLTLLLALFGTGLIAYNCGGGGGSAGSGTVSLYITDDKLESAGKVEVNIKEISMVNTGTGLSCTLFAPDTPYTVDLTDLRNTLELLDTTNCPSGEYNRLVVTLEQSPVEVIYNGGFHTCSLTDYTPQSNGNSLPNRTVCDGSANECYLYITGAVNVLASQNNDVSLDFDLKSSEIEFNGNSCTVAFKVSPLHAEGMEEREHEIKGWISELNTDANTFKLTTKAGTVFTVSYTDDTSNYDDLLNLAQGYNLRAEVECDPLDLTNATCTATDIEVKVEGTADNVDSDNKTLTVDIDGDTSTTQDRIQVVLEPDGEWEGNIQNGSYVEVKLVGYDGSNYIAKEVEEES